MPDKPPAPDDRPLPADAPGTDRGADVLDGWKEIAEYLGKSVRTAQRWEAEFSLPVRRLGGREGEGTYAFRKEIDDWRHAMSSAVAPAVPRPGDLGPEEGPPAAAVAPDRGILARLRRLHPWRTLGAAVILAVVSLLVASLLRRPPQPADFTIRNGRLVVLDTVGRPLWEKTFESSLAGIEQQRAERGVRLADLDGDGRVEVLVVPLTADSPARQVICYESSGRERWAYRPTDTAVFGKERLGAPMVSRLWLHRRPDGSHVPYVSSVNEAEFASLVVRLDPQGAVTARYWSAGYVADLRVMTLRGRERVLVGAAHNESKGGSLAVFDALRFGGSAPASVDYYLCNACPPGAPDIFFVFPRTSISKLFSFAPVTAIHPFDDGFSAVTEHHDAILPGDRDRTVASALYRFDGGMRLVGADYQTAYYKMESFLLGQRLLTKATAQDDKRELWPVQRWSGGRWETISQ